MWGQYEGSAGWLGKFAEVIGIDELNRISACAVPRNEG